MGVVGSIRYNELYEENIPIPFEVFDKIRKSICKISMLDINKETFGISFLMKYNSFDYLFTNYHVITKKVNNIEIELWNKKIIK